MARIHMENHHVQLRLLSRALAIAVALPSATRALHAQATTYTLLGDARSHQTVNGGVLFRADRGALLVEHVAGIGMRVRARIRNGDGGGDIVFGAPQSLATGDTAPALGDIAVRETTDTVFIVGGGLTAAVAQRPLRVVVRDGAGRTLVRETFGTAAFRGRLAHYVADPVGTRYFGVGEQPTGLARNGQVFQLWNTDRYAYEPGQTIYGSVPFYIGVSDGVAHGVLYDNPFRGEMEFANRLPGSIGYTADGGIDGGELRYYVIPGPGIDSTIARFTRLTGRMPLPPRWALGYQQSRYSYYADTVLANVASEFRRRDIPADVLYLDIDYMEGFRVFTWSRERYPNPRATLATVGAQGFKVVTIVDPGVKVDTGFALYRDGLARHAFATLPDGSPARGKVWPDTSVFPDFTRAATRAWWGDAQTSLLDVGVRGIWNDMNEPASFFGGTLSELVQFDGDGRPGTHAEYHNQYGTLMARASYEGQRRARPERRPFAITRAAYTGVQRYAVQWTGDNNSTWNHLRLSIPMVLSLGLSGQPFSGSDVGGFTGDPSAELYARWMQAASLVPFFRTHSATNTKRREPWSFGAEYERANRATIRLRYALVPTLYTAFAQHVRTGAPPLRPVFWGTPNDTAATSVDDEYLVGDHLLVAPVVDSGAVTRSVYLPAGRWYRVGNDSAYGGGRVTVSAPPPLADGNDSTGLRGLPLFARAGAVVAMQPVMPYDGARRVDTLSLHVYPGEATSQLYADAGDGYAYERGEFRMTTIRTSATGLTFTRDGSFSGAARFLVTLHAVDRPRAVTVDGRAVAVRYDVAGRTVSFTVPSGVRRIDVRR